MLRLVSLDCRLRLLEYLFESFSKKRNGFIFLLPASRACSMFRQYFFVPYRLRNRSRARTNPTARMTWVIICFAMLRNVELCCTKSCYALLPCWQYVVLHCTMLCCSMSCYPVVCCPMLQSIAPQKSGMKTVSLV